MKIMNKLNLITIILHIAMLVGVVLNYVNKTGLILYLIVLIINEIARIVGEDNERN